MRNRTKGYFLGSVAAVSYGLNPLFTLPMYHAGMGAGSVLFYRYLFGAVILGSFMLFRGSSFSLRRMEIFPLLVMGLLVSLSSLFLFESYNWMEAGIASTILFIYPVMVAVIMSVCFRERLTKVTVFSILFSLVGIFFLYKGENGTTLSLFGVSLVFLSSLSYAVYIVGINRSSLHEMSPEKLTFYALISGVLVFSVLLCFKGGLQRVPVSYLWVDLLFLVLLPTVVSFVTMAEAIRLIGATPTAILGALEPVTALFIGVLVFEEHLTLRIMTGVLMILSSVILIIVGGGFFHRLFQYFHLRR